MPRYYLKRVLPSFAAVKDRWFLRPLGAILHDPALMALHRKSVGRALTSGVFFGLLPIPGQPVVAGLTAILVRCNLPVAVVSVWITNPVTLGPIFYGHFLFGAWLLDLPTRAFEIELSIRWLTEGFVRVWRPLLLGSLISAAFFSSLTYVGMNGFWQWLVMRRWRSRREPPRPPA
jgi:uncharacterized protein (DUF2062 family)